MNVVHVHSEEADFVKEMLIMQIFEEMMLTLESILTVVESIISILCFSIAILIFKFF